MVHVVAHAVLSDRSIRGFAAAKNHHQMGSGMHTDSPCRSKRGIHGTAIPLWRCDPTRVYFGTDTHAMGLWLGAALAWILPILRHEHGRANESRIMERFHKIWIQFGPIVAFGALLALLFLFIQ